MTGRKITRLRVRNYRGVEVFDQAVPPAGAVIRGPNASGKTSVLRAIRSALAGRDIGSDAIRIDDSHPEKAEIYVDLDCASVRRVITQNGTELTVKQGARPVASPQKWLTDLLGTSPLDPLDFYAKKGADRRTALLAAIPAELDGEAALKMIPAELRPEFPDVLAAIAKGGHALTVSAAVAKAFFEARTETNRQLKAVEAEAETIIAAGPVLPKTDAAKLARDAEDARGALAAAEAQAKRADSQAAHRDTVAARIVDLRSQAKAVLDPEPGTPLMPGEEAAPTPADRVVAAQREIEGAMESEDRAKAALAEAQGRREQLRSALAKAMDDVDSAQAYAERSAARHRDALTRLAVARTEVQAAADAAERGKREALGWLATADELQAGLALTENAPAAEEMTKLRAAVTAAEEARDKGDRERRRREHFDDASAGAAKLRARSDALSRLVNHFREVLPKRIIGTASGIDGLTIEEDRILLDGKDVDACSGQEQLYFAVEIARRANVKSKILIVDRLEALDPTHHEEFVRLAVRDGYQLLATRVDAGENGGTVFDALSEGGE